jgi:hypothetical protein
MSMQRIIAVLVTSCLVAVAAHAQPAGRNPRPSSPSTDVPRVKAPLSFALDTVLFDLERANISPDELVVLPRHVSIRRLYSRAPFPIRPGMQLRPCDPDGDSASRRRKDIFARLRSDGVHVVHMVPCSLITAPVQADSVPRR